MDEKRTSREMAKGSSKPVKVLSLAFPWLLALLLQIQISLLRRELAAFKVQFTGLGEFVLEGKKSLIKRSVGESDTDWVKQASGIEAAHLRGTFPFQKIGKNGRIGPWSLSSSENAFVILKGRNTEVEFTTGGTYHVYAQVYYLTSQSSNSYQILTYNGTEPRENHRTLSTCACQGRNSMGEVSCYTGYTGTFDKGHRVYLHQIEQNRIINNGNGCSFLGIVLLGKSEGDSSGVT